ncbi:DUF1800 domain-containing protein [Roseococcus sp. SYP-B2431]|uniref:DUF1800 domain-containing protein n=1 Tax=Roseococcus sp. SYP-B2431 TaxID=2496640 RepID=UPI0010387E92|nr:DUF1800 domain-containing protein [Roseococcus sp. SYP-B2431]TCI00058.1 DUF1800 domain-containing protein [Roseococcus sp. SYP-B2431]
MTPLAAHAAIRFGLGARPEAPVPADPSAWLASQVAPLPELPGPGLGDIQAALRAQRRDIRHPGVGDIFRAEAAAWAARMITTRIPFAERWANFWTNHLTVSRRAFQTTAWLGHYQRAAIRPKCFGRFEDLLLAAYRHPAMLGYFDQNNSTGPTSAIGRRGRGLNENLARECLELHTVTTAARYSQQDVASLARILTGWSSGRGEQFSEADGFLFRADTHEPGTKRLLGREFPPGEEGGAEALRFLANHPATYRALAAKLARHFIADAPSRASLGWIEGAFRDSRGDLAAVARAILAEPEARVPLRKLRSGEDYAIAMLRALGLGTEGAPALLAVLTRLNQSLWNAPAPDGWSDAATEWAAPEQLMRRLDWASELAGRAAAGGGTDPETLAQTVLGPLARTETLAAMRRTGSARDAMIVLLASPEAQRR